MAQPFYRELAPGGRAGQIAFCLGQIAQWLCKADQNTSVGVSPAEGSRNRFELSQVRSQTPTLLHLLRSGSTNKHTARGAWAPREELSMSLHVAAGLAA